MSLGAARVPLRTFTERVKSGSSGPSLEKIYEETLAAAGKLLSGTSDNSAQQPGKRVMSSNTDAVNSNTDKTGAVPVNASASVASTITANDKETSKPAEKPTSGPKAAVEKVIVAVKKVAGKVALSSDSSTSTAPSTSSKGPACVENVSNGKSNGATSASSSLASGKVFTEVASLKAVMNTGLPSSAQPLGGVVMGVSDCFNVAGLRTTNGVRTSILHHVPEMDDAVVSILRDAGAKFSGKLQSQFPLSYLESAHYDVCSAALAIEKGACHAAVVSSLGGPGGLLSAANNGMCAFLPTLGALPTKPTNKKLIQSSSRSTDGGRCSSGSLSTTKPVDGDQASGEKVGIRKRSHLRNVKYHPTLVAPNVQDLEFLWQSLVEGKKKKDLAAASGGKESAAGASGEGSDSIEGRDSNDKAAAVEEEEETSSGADDDEDSVALQVGIPTLLLQELAASNQDSERQVTSLNSWCGSDNTLSWAEKLQNRGEAKNQLRSGKRDPKERQKIVFEDVEISKEQLDDAFKHSVVITQYDLARNMKESMELSGGVMDEISPRLVPAIFAGQQICENQYNDAKEAIAELRKEMDEELNEVDVIALPLVGPPFSSGNFRSTMCSLPFAACGFPLVSLPGSTFSGGGQGIGPVQLVGELGADRGLLGDAILFRDLLQ